MPPLAYSPGRNQYAPENDLHIIRLFASRVKGGANSKCKVESSKLAETLSKHLNINFLSMERGILNSVKDGVITLFRSLSQFASMRA